MITKVKLLKTIGKFYNYTAKGDGLDWHKNTFVFARNAYGKSTLVNVLRSLRDNEPNLICARKTLGVATAPEAVIVIDGRNYVFSRTRWDKPFRAIKIFDVPFIYENILTQEIAHEHKKNIHKIIIGAKGIKLAEEFASLKAKEKTKIQGVTSLSGQFNQGRFTFLLDAFLAIPPEEETTVDPRIQKFERDIKSKQTETVVRGLSYPSNLSTLEFKPSDNGNDIAVTSIKKEPENPVNYLENLKILVSQSLASVQETTEKQVLDHIERNFKNKTHAKQFIQQGLELVQVDCPFCGQDLKHATGLLKAYREFFDEAFRNFQLNIAQQVSMLTKWNLDNDLTGLVSTHNANLATLRQWEPYIGVITLPDIIVIVEKSRSILSKLKGKVQSELEKKQKDPNIKADLSQFDAFSAELTEVKTAIQIYNSAVVAFSEKAKEYVATLPKADVSSIQAAWVKELQIKKRFAPEWKNWATDYSTAKKAADDLLKQKSEKQKELEEYSKSIFDVYQKRINVLLSTLGTDFTITGLTGKTDDRAVESYSDFGFLILKQVVPLTARQDDAPCFKNTLSEGDKSTLAFAFFIASLERTPELDKQIVVFDDPLSSLDETRRFNTASILMELSPKINQLCVFTHHKNFLEMLFDEIRDNKVFQIRSDKTAGSWIEIFDVDESRKGDHARRIEKIERYIAADFGPTPDEIQGDFRKIFETVLKTKYYRVLISEIKSNGSLSKLLKKLIDEKVIDVALHQKLFEICSISNVPHHGEIIDVASRKLTRDELIPLVNEAFKILEKV